MKKNLVSLIIVIATALLIAGCASKEGTGNAAQAGKESRKVSISTGEFHEFCENWEVGDTVNLSFTSTKPVMFNVHYHANHVKYYPIKDTLVDEYSGSFVVQHKDTHCGFWQNNNNNYVKLTYEMEVVKK